MRDETQFIQVNTSLARRYETVSCPAQVLVIDRINGPADVLVSTVGLLLNREVSVTLVDDHADALRALDCCQFDLVVVGLEHDQPLQLAVLPHIHHQHPDKDVIVVGKRLSYFHTQYAQHYGARDVVKLPEHAADLKALVLRLAEAFLQAA
jgi:DNA-binding NtrC family response regulator